MLTLYINAKKLIIIKIIIWSITWKSQTIVASFKNWFSINDVTKRESVHEPMMGDLVNEKLSIPLVIMSLPQSSASLQFSTLKWLEYGWHNGEGSSARV